MLTTEYLITILVDTDTRERRAAADGHRSCQLARWRRSQRPAAGCA